MYRQMPAYNRDQQDAYLKQMYEWHTQMAQHQQQLRSFHMERANYFRGIAGGEEKILVGNGTT